MTWKGSLLMQCLLVILKTNRIVNAQKLHGSVFPVNTLFQNKSQYFEIISPPKMLPRKNKS